MRTMLKTALGVMAFAFASLAAAQVTFYEGEGFRGRSFTANEQIDSLDPTGFNDRAASAVVAGGSWEVCADAYFQGRCTILQPGSYDSLRGVGLYRRISSVRPVGGPGYGDASGLPGAPAVAGAEQLYSVPVSSVHAVVGPPEQRCWVERQQVVEQNAPNVPGAIIGGIIGGVLGHQIGSGRGRDVATAGGAVAGAALGANVNRGTQAYDRDVQRCTTVPSSARPDYWDVTYYFRGIEHHAQLNHDPGPALTVDEHGNPRG